MEKFRRIHTIKILFIVLIKSIWQKIKEVFSFIFSKIVWLIILTFLLVNFYGGKLTEAAQKRFSNYQHEQSNKDSEIQAATKIFEDVSKLMDERIYRMQKLNWELEENTDSQKIKTQMDAYRISLYDWNDNRNRNFALISRYFGEEKGKYFDADIHTAIKDTGKLLENYYYMPRWQRKKEIGWEIDGRIGDLENKSRQLNIDMLRFIQKQEVGIFNPDVKNN